MKTPVKTLCSTALAAFLAAGCRAPVPAQPIAVQPAPLPAATVGMAPTPTAVSGVEVRVEGDGGTVFLDDSVMQLVTMHCLNNAAKYTKHGSITLRYGSRDGGLLIEVADTGPGLPEELRENIFALLTAKDTYVQKEVPGLGLSICKAIVDRRGGRIGATSPPGGGTVLWHWVPVKVRP